MTEISHASNDVAAAAGGASIRRPKPVDADTYVDVLHFLYHEAALLDAHQYEDWLKLLSKDIVYRMPLTLTREADEQDKMFDGDIGYFDDNYQSLDMRVRRLQTDFAWAEDPPTRTRHVVTNVRVTEGDEPGTVVAEADFAVHTNRGDAAGWLPFIGSRADVLARGEDDWVLNRRILWLDQAVLGVDSISIFL